MQLKSPRVLSSKELSKLKESPRWVELTLHDKQIEFFIQSPSEVFFPSACLAFFSVGGHYNRMHEFLMICISKEGSGLPECTRSRCAPARSQSMLDEC